MTEQPTAQENPITIAIVDKGTMTVTCPTALLNDLLLGEGWGRDAMAYALKRRSRDYSESDYDDMQKNLDMGSLEGIEQIETDGHTEFTCAPETFTRLLAVCTAGVADRRMYEEDFGEQDYTKEELADLGADETACEAAISQFEHAILAELMDEELVQ